MKMEAALKPKTVKRPQKKGLQRIGKEMQELNAVLRMIPTFIQMAENDLGEATHRIDTELTAVEFARIERFAAKLNSCIHFVDQTIFE